jgi:hypothetical protein
MSHMLRINSTISIFVYQAKQNILCIKVEISLLVFGGKAMFICLKKSSSLTTQTLDSWA